MRSALATVFTILFALVVMPTHAQWQFETIDSAGSVGSYPEIALDSQGYKHVAYYDSGLGDVKYAYWDGDSWNIETVDSAGDVGSYLSFTLDSDDHPHIAYYDDTGLATGHLKHAHWNGSSWQIEIVDYTLDEDCGQDSAIQIDSNGYPHISYVDNYNVHLRYARWDGSAWQLETVDNGSYVGLYGDLVLDADDHAHICYRDNSVGNLKYAEWDGSSWQIEIVDSNGSVGAFTSIVLDAAGYPHISYYDWPDNLRYARWTGSSWAIETVDGGGRHTSMELDANGYPHISHDEYSTSSLKYAKWDGSVWQLETVDNSGYVGVGTSLALTNLDMPHIVYLDAENGDLDYAWIDDPAPTGTVDCSYLCNPSSGTVPFPTTMTVTLTNLYTEQVRRMSGHIDVTLASSTFFANWRAGFTNIASGGSYSVSWNTTIPALGTVVGDNLFELIAEDVTPAPYNQPPYPAAGDTATDSCTVTAHAP